MNLVHSKSQECTKSELDLFSVPPTQISLEKGHWVDHQPVSSVANGGPITFLFPGTEDYVDPTSYPGFSLCGRGLKRTLAKAVKIIHNLWIILSRGMYEQGGTFYRLLNVVSVC